MMTPMPVALARSGRKTVIVGFTTLRITVPSGVSSTLISFWVQVSEPGGTPCQTFTCCALIEQFVSSATTTAANAYLARRELNLCFKFIFIRTHTPPQKRLVKTPWRD